MGITGAFTSGLAIIEGTGDHPYVFTLNALSVEKLDWGPNTFRSGFKKAVEGKTLGSARLTGKYGR
jgi:phosphatidylethanolamine-binding protein (PEBP) family uncharacterized protein